MTWPVSENVVAVGVGIGVAVGVVELLHADAEVRRTMMHPRLTIDIGASRTDWIAPDCTIHKSQPVSQKR
jgi:hypothetical protein